jgi:putative peptidoglycan lipid II flippase
VGLTIAFPRPVRLGEVRIDSLSAGSRVEIRTAPRGGGPDHAARTIGGAVLVSGVTRIPVAATAAPMSEVLVWITELAAVGPGRFRTSLSEVGFSGDTGP